nr:hypothetical protein BgiMline_033395 [Biomphalaria glabrata]
MKLLLASFGCSFNTRQSTDYSSEESYCQEVPDVWSPVRRLMSTGRQVPFAIYRTQSVDNLEVYDSSSSGHKADHNS